MTGGDFSLKGKTILVTGAARGLGAAIATACARHGATLYLQDVDEAGVEVAAQALRDRGFAASASAFDLTDIEACVSWITVVERESGGIWGLINNAGITNHGHVSEQSVNDYRSMYDLHVFAPFVLAREVAKVMLKSEGPQRGRILSMSSIAWSNPRSGIGNYASSKAAIVGLTRALAADLGAQGICANAIAPGYILTEMNKKILSDEGFVKRIEKRTPANRWAEPKEVAGPAVFLMSEACSYVNGQVLAVDGGMSAFLCD